MTANIGNSVSHQKRALPSTSNPTWMITPSLGASRAFIGTSLIGRASVSGSILTSINLILKSTYPLGSLGLDGCAVRHGRIKNDNNV